MFAVGNESCDLDSAISAISWAYHLHHKNDKKNGTMTIPVFNIIRDHRVLKSETKYYMSQIGFDKVLCMCVKINKNHVALSFKTKK